MNIYEYDNTLTNEELISKVDNMFIMLYTSIMLQDIDRVKHKISDSLYEKYKNIIDHDKYNNLVHKFDELNVKSTNIKNIEIRDNKIIIKIELVSRAMDYYVDLVTKKYISGNNKSREEHINTITLEKNINAKLLGDVKRCPGCGAAIDVSYSGFCPFCNSSFNTEDYDYMMTDIITK